jgi:hypothetical protein
MFKVVKNVAFEKNKLSWVQNCVMWKLIHIWKTKINKKRGLKGGDHTCFKVLNNKETDVAGYQRRCIQRKETQLAHIAMWDRAVEKRNS